MRDTHAHFRNWVWPLESLAGQPYFGLALLTNTTPSPLLNVGYPVSRMLLSCTILKRGRGVGSQPNRIWNGISEILQSALDLVNCFNYFCRPLSGVYIVFMQIVVISVIYPNSSKFIFTKVTKCVVQRDLWQEKSDKRFFLTKLSIQRRNLVCLVSKLIHI